MTPIKRNLSVAAIIIASIAFGMILTADLGWMKSSHAQQSIQTTQGAVPTVTIPSFASLAERAMPAVVSIRTTEIFKESDRRQRGGGQVDPFDFFFPDPSQQRQQPNEDEEHQERSGGSGFIISPDGYILTNNHVVEDATRVEVQYGSNDVRVEAKIIGRDPETDLALIKIDVKEQLPVLRLGDSEAIRVGDWAIAIGNPFQFANTLTVGVISAKDRALGISETTRSFENFIQTDAAINFGNSGGPLLNINGEVVGINTAIRGGAQNLGFATPVNIAKQVLPQLREKGKVTRGYLGIRIQDVSAEDKEAFNLPSVSGAIVQSVEEGKPAERAGVQHGDVIIKVDNVEVRKTRDLINYVSLKAPGTNVSITLIRNGERRTVTAKVEERPGGDTASVEETGTGTDAPARDRLGISVQELNGTAGRSFGIPENTTGVLVSRVKEVSPAADAGLAAGDVITEANGLKLTSVAQFRDVVTKARSGSYLRLYATRYQRGGGRSQSFFAIVKVP